MALGRAWTGAFVSDPAHLPISFLYDGSKVTGIPAAWTPTARTRWLDATMRETIFEGTDPRTGLTLRVEWLDYRDYPVVEWTAWLVNRAHQPTPLLQDILALDATFAGASPVLWHSNGDFYSEDGYAPEETPLPTGSAVAVAPTGGRSCDGAFPYFRVRFADRGLTIAVGWPAQWAASFAGTATGVTVTAGQQKTSLRLLPGETIRTPRMTLLSWTGDTERAVNLWRRWYLAHVLPRPDGQPLAPLLAVAATDDGEEFTAATTENQIRYMDMFTAAGIPYDVWWIDAGWYPCANDNHERKWVLTGTWEPDPARFPQGLKPVSDNAATHGAALLLWFEPERVAPGSWLDLHHPDWLLRVKRTDEGFTQWALLNLGNPACRAWLTDHYCTLIAANGVKIYRQDFNFPPLRYWRENEAEDRQGITENLHVQGYLQFWDDLLLRNPGLWIDSCSSGGRRNDLETLRRSVPLHYTDYGYGIHAVKLAFHHTLYAWIPYFKDFTLSWDVTNPGDDTRFDKRTDSFSFHCGLAPMLFLSMDIRRDNTDVALATAMAGIWRGAADLLLNGDYYPLTPYSKGPDQWVVWQFDRPERGDGVIQGIRLAACPTDEITVSARALRADADYLLSNLETGETREVSGSVLTSAGLTLALPRRSGAIWFYQLKPASAS